MTRSEKAEIWIHEHPTTTKVLNVAALILSLGLLVSLPFTAPFLAVGITVGLAITGTLLTLASLIAFVVLDLIVPPHHDMKNHVYKPGSCEGGKLYYAGDVPILSLDSDDPFKAGKAHGYLCGDAINRLTKRFAFVLHTLARQPKADQLPNTLAALRQVILPEHLREMEGLVEGYKQWAQEQSRWRSIKPLTIDDVLLLHLMPDSLHFQAGVFEQRLAGRIPVQQVPERAVACSAILDRDPEEGFVFARNMDWPSFGLAGTYSLVINRKHANGLHNTVEVGVPGIVGTLTGMNSRGLSIAMNVCAGMQRERMRELSGQPVSLYNRACLDRCGSVSDVEAFVQDRSPLGAYHLTAADPKSAESIHFYQSPEGTHVIRRWEENHPLVTLNYRYDPQPDYDMHCSAERQQMINDFFRHRANRPLEEALSLPFVNNSLTTHRVIMIPPTGIFKVAFDNAFAGKAPLHTIPTQNLLA